MTTLRLLTASFRMTAHYKLRTCAMMLGSVLGVSALTFVVSLGTGAERKVLQTVRNFVNSETIIVTKGSGMFGTGPREESARLTLDDIEAVISASPSIATWDPMLSLPDMQVRFEDTTTTARLLGGSERGERVWNRGVTHGEYFDASMIARSARVALLGETVARNLFFDRDPLGADVLVGSVLFHVIGLLEPLGTDAHGMDRDNEILAPISTVMHRVANSDTISGAKLLVSDPSKIASVAAETRQVLRERHALNPDTRDDFKLITPTDMQDMVNRARRVFFVFLPLAATVTMLAGALVSAALMLLSVNQRKAEIGLRRAVGARPKDIALQFIGETATTTLFGGIFGLIVGTIGSLLIARRIGIDGGLSWQAAVVGIVLSSIFGILAGIVPARRAALLEPTDALR